MEVIFREVNFYEGDFLGRRFFMEVIFMEVIFYEGDFYGGDFLWR